MQFKYVVERNAGQFHGAVEKDGKMIGIPLTDIRAAVAPPRGELDGYFLILGRAYRDSDDGSPVLMLLAEGQSETPGELISNLVGNLTQLHARVCYCPQRSFGQDGFFSALWDRLRPQAGYRLEPAPLIGDPEWGLGLPLPTLMAWLAALTESVGALFLLFGFALRYISIPLMITMVVAAVTVHWQNGWLAIAEGAGSLFANDRTLGAIERLDRAKELLREYGHYDWLTENGGFVVLNNGIEFAATYFVMLLALFFIGAGRYVSIDYWLRRRFMPSKGATQC